MYTKDTIQKAGLWLIALLLLPAGCIIPYDASVPGELNRILVVEGFITQDTTVITLTRTVDLTVGVIHPVCVDGATLHVECSDGNVSAASESLGDRRYAIPTGVLSPDAQYRLYILLNDGEQYRSSFLTPLLTPGVELGWERDGVFFHVNLSTRSRDETDRYYVWSYREIWEITSELYADSFRWNNQYYYPKEVRYCWKKDRSRALILGNTEKLTGNAISEEKPVRTMYADNERLTVLYYIHVRQNLLRKESFLYFANLQKNIEQNATIFTPVPSEIRGNVTCVTSPDKPAIGFVEVSLTSCDSLFVTRDEAYDPALSLPQACDCETLGWDCAYAYPQNRWFHLQCLDCTQKQGSKEKPDFWPNDHK